MFCEMFVSWNICFTITELTRKSCGFLAANLSVRLSKLNPTWPQNLVGEEHFLKYSSIFLDVKTDSFESRWSCCLKTLSEVFFNFFFFGLWAVTFPTFGRKFNGWVTQTDFYGSRGDFFKKKLHEKGFFPSISDFELIIFAYLAKKFGSIAFSDFSDSVQKVSDFMLGVFCRITIYAFYAPKGVFWRNFVYESALHIHGFHAIRGASFFAKNFLVGLSIWIQSVQIIQF